MRFRTVVQRNGKNATGLPVPPDVLAALDAGKRPAVTVTVRGHTYRTTVGSVGGAPMLSLSAENRQAAGVDAGDEVDVDVQVDSAPRVVQVPADLADALAADGAARAAFERLPYSHQLAYVQPVEQAKKPETRQRRIEKTIAALRASVAG